MHRGFAPILVLTIGLAIVAAVSVIYFQLKPKTPPVPESVSLATPTPSDETVYTDPGSADWKTYRNEKYGFTLKYPNDWQIKSENETGDSVTTKTTLQSKDLATKEINTPGIGGEQLTKGSILEISVSNNTNFKSYEQLRDFMENKFTGFPLNYFTNSKEITVDEVKATLKRGGKSTTLALGNSFCYFFKDGITYETTFSNSENNDTLFNQILSTFKFVE